MWKNKKIETAIEVLEKLNENKPLLYSCNVDFYDAKMNFIKSSKVLDREFTFERICVEPCLLGMTFVFNNLLLDLVRNVNPNNVDGHDYIVSMIASGFGKIIYDETPWVRYRRYDNTTSPTGMNFLFLFIWRLKKFLFLKNNKIVEQWNEFYKLFHTQLNGRNLRFMSLLSHKTCLSNFRLFFYPRRLRKKNLDELFLRIMFLLNLL